MRQLGPRAMPWASRPRQKHPRSQSLPTRHAEHCYHKTCATRPQGTRLCCSRPLEGTDHDLRALCGF